VGELADVAAHVGDLVGDAGRLIRVSAHDIGSVASLLAAGVCR
jgi:hypothetical protein